MPNRLFSTLAFLVLAACASASEPREVSGTIGNGGLLIIKGQVNTVSIRSVIDTGASHHVYDRKLMPFLDGLESGEPNAAIDICDPQHLVIGPLVDVVNAGSAVADLSPFNLKAKERIDAVIGMPFLIGRAIHVYPSRQSFAIQETAILDNKGLCIQLDESSRPCVLLTIGGKEVLALIDTGSNAEITASEVEFERILSCLTEGKKPSIVDVQTLDGVAQRRKITNCDIAIDGSLVRDVTIVESKSTKIGMAFLTRFEAVIDLLNMRLRLKTISDGQ